MIIIGIAGGSGSGKTTVVKKIIESLPNKSVAVISQDAYYKNNTPPEFHNRRIQQTNELRYQRLQELLKKKGKFNEDDFINILRDHSGLESGSDDTLCRHDVRIGTIASIIFYPQRKKLNLLFGRACQNEYREFTFGD